MIDPMHDDPTRVQLPAQVTSARVVVILPGDIGLNAAIAPIEVLVQEGFNVFSLPAAADLTAAQLHSIFGSRIFLGVHDIADTEQARRLIDEQARFACHLNAFEAEAMLLDAGVPVFAGALTPLEAAQTWQRGVSAVQISPAGIFGNSYATHLAAMLPGVTLATRGAESSFEVRAWLGAGAAATFVGEKLLGDALRGGDLAELRARAKPFVEAREPQKK